MIVGEITADIHRRYGETAKRRMGLRDARRCRRNRAAGKDRSAPAAAPRSISWAILHHGHLADPNLAVVELNLDAVR